MTFVVVPQGQGDLSTRSFEVSYRRLRVVGLLAAAALVAWIAMAASWWYVAAQAARVPGLQREIAKLEQDRVRVEQLARIIQRMERQYDQVRIILGVHPDSVASASPASGAAGDSVGAWAPPLPWPLSRRGHVTRGYVTRGYGGRVNGSHPGIDIAVASGTTVRAVHPGTVAEAREDPVYGRFVRVAHPAGYESLYAHASRLLVRTGEPVDTHQPVALSGNTGASTAPHLHFEIRRHGQPVDPRPLLRVDD